MENRYNKLASDSHSIEGKNRKNSFAAKSVKNAQILYGSKISKQSSNNNKKNQPLVSGKKNNANSQEISQLPKSMFEYQENRVKNNLEVLQKQYQREIADIIKFELDKQLLQFKLNKEQNDIEKAFNNKKHKSFSDKMILSLMKKENEKKINNSKEKSEINKEDQKSKEKESLPPKPLNIVNEKNFHENFHLMEQAKKQQLFEINEKKKQKRLENFEKINKIKAEQNELKKRIHAERASQNLQRNNYELDNRKNNIETQIIIRDLNVYQNRKRKNEKIEEQIKKNKLAEEEKNKHIKQLRLNEEKNRISLYLDIIKKEKSMEKKKLENLEIKEKYISQYSKLNIERNNNLKKLKKLIKNGVDEGNIEKFYSEFPENKEINKIFEKYKKEKNEIENKTCRIRDKKKLNPIKKISDDNSNDMMSKTYYEMKNKTVKIPKINVTEIQSNPKNDKENININKENNKETNEKDKEINKIINICSTNNNNINNNKNENTEENKNINDDKKDNLNKNEENKEKLNSTESLFDDNRKVLFETEIRDKIREYKKERYQPFIKMLEREKINEDNRNKKLENIKDENEKSKLENQFGKERTLVSLRLKKENEKILLDVQNYEKKIREENEQNQKYNMERINMDK